MAQFKTLQFPNTPQGQTAKIRTLEQETALGWRVVSETIVPGKFRGGQACCLFMIFAPCAFLAGYSNDIINVTLEMVDKVPDFDKTKWDALLLYDKDVSSAANMVRPWGSRWMDELAAGYMALADNKYLPEIVESILFRAKQEQLGREAEMVRQAELKASEARERARVLAARKEQYQRFYDALWGNNIRRVTTVISVAAVVIILAAIGCYLYSRFILGPIIPNSLASIPSLSVTTMPVPPGAILIQPNVWVKWDSTKTGRSNTFVVDGMAIQASSIKTKDGFMPVIKVTAPTGQNITFKGAEDFGADSASMNFGVGRFDAYSPIPQVVMTSYSGGAHCCLNIKVADFYNGAWRALTVYDANTDQINFPSDVSGDGQRDFVLSDERFNYVFASYAGSWGPPLVLDIVRARVVDVSKYSRYRSLYEADFAKAKEACGTDQIDTEINGACAAYVADGARLGRLDDAWSFMLAHYDHANGGGDDPAAGFLPTKCFVPLVNYECPAGKEHTFATYPEALRWFLGDNGYLPPVEITPN